MVQVTSALPIAKMIGSNRVILGCGIVHVAGDPSLPAEEEKNLRRRLVRQALDALESDEET